jgi:hypothetical protein
MRQTDLRALVAYSSVVQLIADILESTVTEWLKSHTTHSWRLFSLAQNNLYWNYKKEYSKCWKCPPRSARCVGSLFSSCLLQPAEQFTRQHILSVCLAQENRKMYPHTHSGRLSKNEMPGNFRHWALVVLVVEKASLHLTVQRQQTDWREQVTTWRDLRGFLYSHKDIVCLLTQMNCIEI